MTAPTVFHVPTAEKDRALRRLREARTNCDTVADASPEIQALATQELRWAEALCRELGAVER